MGALIGAGAGYAIQGMASAFIAAAVGYWIGYKIAEEKDRSATRDFNAHNAEVPDWQKTIEGWEKERVDLQNWA